MRRHALVIGLSAATILSVAALWLLPPVGFVACLVLLIIVPPWGRSLSERAIISVIVLLGVIAVAFPRAGSTPVSSTSARLVLTVYVIALLGLRFIPRYQSARLPRPSLADGLVLLLAAASSFWLMLAFIGKQAFQLVGGLYYMGWDNNAHFTTFANTYAVGSTTWPTTDGSIAWNQWYPSLHTTTWALAQYATESGAAAVDRIALLWPYVQWSAISYSLSMAGLAWVAGDFAERVTRPGDGRSDGATWIRALAISAVGAFALLGSPTFLFNKGFTNFLMGVSVTVVVAYFSARSWRSARVIGWFLIPLGVLVVIGLWTPLAVGMVPSAVVVAIALFRYRWWVGVIWVVTTVAGGLVLAATQMSAIMGVEPGTSAGDFTTTLGSVGTGMSSFNLAAGLISPIIALVVAAVLVQQRRWPTPVAVVGPVLGALILVIVFIIGTDAAGVGRLQSYYVLKSIDAMLLAVAPIIAAVLAIGLVRAVRGLDRFAAGAAIALGGLLMAGMFGYVGVVPGNLQEGFSTAPGVAAGIDRAKGTEDALVGDAIIRASVAAEPYPDYTTLLWDGSGLLPNLWVASLTGVISKNENTFYKNLPQFPYDQKTADYVSLAMNINPTLQVAALWFREVSGALLDDYVAQRGDDRVVPVQVPMPSSPLCQECSLS